MRGVTRGQLLLACSACLLIGWVWGTLGPARLPAEPAPPKKAEPPAFPIRDRLGSYLYVQTSAEYRACCLQIYKCAELRLQALLERASPRPSKPAVVMDLDETVIDNAAFQTLLYVNKLEFAEDLWAEFEGKHQQDLGLVPGAKQFIEKAGALGVTVVFMSNRTETNRKATMQALERLGVGGHNLAGRLYLRPKGGSSDKSARREAVAARYNVLMIFGDNLRDFSETFVAPKMPKGATPKDYLKAIERRAAVVDEAACHWGVDWFILPNPMYGEWERLVGPDPRAVLRPTSMKPKVRAAE
jgi:acid phosphatase